MLKIALKMYRKTINLQMFIVIQLAAVLTICVFMVSSVYSRLELYLPIEHLMNSNASATLFTPIYRDIDNNNTYKLDFRNAKPFSDDFGNISETCYTRYAPYISSEQIEAVVNSYCENTFSLYTPKLEQGDWLNIMNQSLTQNGAIPAVICQNGYNYKIGDIISMNTVNYENERFEVLIEVCGIMNPESMIFGNSDISGGMHNHTSFYQTAESTMNIDENDENQNAMSIFVSQNLVDTLGIVSYFDECAGIVLYDDDISDDTVVMNTTKLKQKYNQSAENIENINTQSKRYISYQLFFLIPIVLCIGILTVVTGVCTNAVCTKRSIRSYAIYNLCGSTIQKSVSICIIQSVFTALLSVFISIFAIILLSKITNLRLVINAYTVLLCLVVILLNTIFSTTMPYHILKKSEIREELK